MGWAGLAKIGNSNPLFLSVAGLGPALGAAAVAPAVALVATVVGSASSGEHGRKTLRVG